MFTVSWVKLALAKTSSSRKVPGMDSQSSKHRELAYFPLRIALRLNSCTAQKKRITANNSLELSLTWSPRSLIFIPFPGKLQSPFAHSVPPPVWTTGWVFNPSDTSQPHCRRGRGSALLRITPSPPGFGPNPRPAAAPRGRWEPRPRSGAKEGPQHMWVRGHLQTHSPTALLFADSLGALHQSSAESA